MPDDYPIAYKLRNRLRALRWLAEQHTQYPEGLVPLPTAARVLSVSRQTIDRMIDRGMLRVVTGMPGGHHQDRWIPVIDLFTAPTGLEGGRPWVVDIRTGKTIRDDGNPQMWTKPIYGYHNVDYVCEKCRRRELRRKRRQDNNLRRHVR